MVKLNSTFTGFVPWEDGSIYKEITPKGYVEGPFMFLRKGKYYLMWSEGGWGNDSYKVAYAMADKATGPFNRIGTILQSDKSVATGAGHHSVIHNAATDKWYIIYHRRPLGETAANHRATCIEEMVFDDKGNILPVKLSFTGVAPQPL